MTQCRDYAIKVEAMRYTLSTESELRLTDTKMVDVIHNFYEFI